MSIKNLTDRERELAAEVERLRTDAQVLGLALVERDAEIERLRVELAALNAQEPVAWTANQGTNTMTDKITIENDTLQKMFDVLEPIGEVIISTDPLGREGVQVVKWSKNAPATLVGTKLYAAPVVPSGMALVPDYRGYAALGTGQYILDISGDANPAELIIHVATDDEKEGRTVGDLRDRDVPGESISPVKMAVRLAFFTVAGLDALEQQLRILRETHFAPDA